MSLQLRLFGGGQSDAGKLNSSNDGNHAIDKSKVLAQTDAGVITPKLPVIFQASDRFPLCQTRATLPRASGRMKELGKGKNRRRSAV
jgi:hypothetical protein